METSIYELLKDLKKYDSQSIALTGFIKTNRSSNAIGFISLNDGSCFQSAQIVFKSNLDNFSDIAKFRTNSTIKVIGELKLTPDAKQPFEIIANEITLLKDCSEDYPLQKKEHSLEFLREIAHLRPKTNLFSALMRIRSKLAFAIHEFFNSKNFVWVSSPIITSNDGEGAGEGFYLDKIDNQEFFNTRASLSVTGQLQAEAYAQAFHSVYTFGPTFRAEKSHTNRHASEFWMLEPEVSNCDLFGLMDLGQNLLQFVTRYYVDNCSDEINYLIKNINPDLMTNINCLLENEYEKLEYVKAIELLQELVKKGHVFEQNEIYFGMDLGSEHERAICEIIFKKPVFIYNYPKDIKAFYMKQNADNKTVAATDLLVPGVGELIGGSQREADFDKLMKRCNELNMNTETLDWYLNLRKYGYYMSSGFGLGFERLIMYLTGVNNIRDVIPFPRTHGQLKF